MASRRTPRPRPRGLTTATPSSPWANIELLIAEGGNISVGRVSPIRCAAVASDDHNMLAALVRRDDETFMDLMQRFDVAVGKALDNGEFTDEINAPRPSRR